MKKILPLMTVSLLGLSTPLLAHSGNHHHKHHCHHHKRLDTSSKIEDLTVYQKNSTFTQDVTDNLAEKIKFTVNKYHVSKDFDLVRFSNAIANHQQSHLENNQNDIAKQNIALISGHYSDINNFKNLNKKDHLSLTSSSIVYGEGSSIPGLIQDETVPTVIANSKKSGYLVIMKGDSPEESDLRSQELHFTDILTLNPVNLYGNSNEYMQFSGRLNVSGVLKEGIDLDNLRSHTGNDTTSILNAKKHIEFNYNIERKSSVYILVGRTLFEIKTE